MPINQAKMDSMKEQYGEDKGEEIYYATENRQKKSMGSMIVKALAAKKAMGEDMGQRIEKADGGEMALPPEVAAMAVPEDTYDNILPEEKAAVEASQLPDDEMEDDFVEHTLQKVLSEEEYNYLQDAMMADDRLSVLVDKVILSASEFSGAGKVEGPGDGTSDSIPARLSDGEFVFTKKAVDEIGADTLQRMMDEAEQANDQRNGRAVGGLMKDQLNLPLGTSGTVTTVGNVVDDEVKKQMLRANRMPSLLQQ